jgi:hypothetical protein
MAATVSAAPAAAAGMEPTGIPAPADSSAVSNTAADRVQGVQGEEDADTEGVPVGGAPSGAASFGLPLQELQGLTLADIRARVPKGMVPEPKVPTKGITTARGGGTAGGYEGESKEDRALRKSLTSQLAAAESACWDSSSVDTSSRQLPGLVPMLLRAAVALAAIVGIMLNTTTRVGAPRLGSSMAGGPVAASVTVHASRARGPHA